jgi:phosphonate transport system permease protein
MEERILKAYEDRPKGWLFELACAVVVVALLVWSGSAVEASGTGQDGGQIALNILAGIAHPDTSLLFNLTTGGVPYLLVETICIAFLGTVVGAIISIPLAFLASRNPYRQGSSRTSPVSSSWPSVRCRPSSTASCSCVSLALAPSLAF